MLSIHVNEIAEHPAILKLYPYNSGYVATRLRGCGATGLRGYGATRLRGYVATRLALTVTLTLSGYAAT